MWACVWLWVLFFFFFSKKKKKSNVYLVLRSWTRYVEVSKTEICLDRALGAVSSIVGDVLCIVYSMQSFRILSATDIAVLSW